MNRALPLIALVSLAGCSFAWANDKPLASFIAELKRQAPSNKPAPVSVSAVGHVEGHELLLHFTLTNITDRPLTVYELELPWGHIYSITWAAMTGDGRVLTAAYPFDDPFGLGEKISLAPHQSLNGSYHLNWVLSPAAVPRNTDIAVVWLYNFPAGPSDTKQDTRPYFTGVVHLHTP